MNIQLQDTSSSSTSSEREIQPPQPLLRRKEATVAPSARKKLEINSTAAATTVRSPTFNFVSTTCLYEFLQLISLKRISSRLFVICTGTYFHKTWWSGAVCLHGLAYCNSQETVQCDFKIGLHCLHTGSLLLQFGDFNKPTFSSHKFSFLFPTHDSLSFPPHSVAEDLLKAHEDHIGAKRNVQSPCQLKASILSWAFHRMSLQHGLLTFTSPHQMTWAVALETSRWRRLGLSHP